MMVYNTQNSWVFGLCPSSGIQLLTLALSKGPITVGVSPSPEGGNRSSFRNVVFYSFLEYWMMEKVQKPSNSGDNLFFENINIIGALFASSCRESQPPKYATSIFV
jgi:hypothetical protein